MAGGRGSGLKSKGFGRRAAGFAVAFAISLVVGRFFEVVASKPAIETALDVQSGWMEALDDFSPWGVAALYGDKLTEDAQSRQRRMYFDAEGKIQYTNPSGSPRDGLVAPMMALFATVGALVSAGGIAGLVQICMGILAVWLGLDVLKRRGLFEATNGLVLILGWPLAVIFAAGLIAVVLKTLMLGALGALSWVTGLAAGAAGATGVAGFCWYCLQKLGEKGAEHALTPKI